jgi:hypothetical protein
MPTAAAWGSIPKRGISLRTCNRHDHATGLHGMLDQLMGACNLIQGYNLRYIESVPPRRALLMSWVASILASSGTSSLPTKKSLAFKKTSYQTGVSVIGVLVA